MAGLGVVVFSKDNVGKSRRDNPKTKIQRDVNRENNLSIGVDVNGGTRADNPSTGTDTDVGANGRSEADNLGIRTDMDRKVNMLDIAADD